MMAAQSPLKEFSKLLPAEVNGWKKSQQPTFYTPENLYEYINGGAELYISYQFKNLLALTYKKEDLPDIAVDIFDMGRSADAYGVFAQGFESLDQSVEPGVESEYAAGLLTFWKGRYYVSILAYPENESKKKTVLVLGKHIAGLIPQRGEKPALLKRLPIENLIPGSIRYFRHYVWLNSLYYISDKNILNIDEHTDVVMAKYKEKTIALLAAYPDETKAEAAYRSFLKHYLPDAPKGLKQVEDNRWTGCKFSGNLVAVVFNAPSDKTVKTLLEKVFLRGEK